VSLAQSATLPIVKIAAGAVIIFSAVGVGVMTGLISGVSSQERPAQTEQAPAVQDPIKTTAPAEEPVQPKPVAKQPVRVAAAQPVREERTAPPVCFDCGVVESVSAVDVKGEASGLGAVAGGVAGLVLGNQIGHGKGRTLAKVAGAAGGAYAGHQIEKNAKKTTQYEVAIRMDDGSRRTVTQASSDGLWAGSRVKVLGDTVIRDGG
jgi:outer membrane lipoprotein SlyB